MTPSARAARQSGRRAHLVHAAVAGMHALCCGVPLLVLTIAGLSGVATGASALARVAGTIHGEIHPFEMWIILLSAGLLTLGAVLEVNARRGPVKRGFPWLFALSGASFVMNVTMVAAHTHL